jgi:hypothetical protein
MSTTFTEERLADKTEKGLSVAAHISLRHVDKTGNQTRSQVVTLLALSVNIRVYLWPIFWSESRQRVRVRVLVFSVLLV